MNKDLKKLKRVELLELLVRLSEDYEALVRENAKLKKMLSKQRLPRSTKVGSIAEAALAANGYFEAVQRSADEYLREIKHLRDVLAARTNEAGQAAPQAAMTNEQAQALLADARVRAGRIVAQANTQADAILANARTQAEQTVANANRESHAMISQASRQAEALRAQAMASASAQADASQRQRANSTLSTGEILKRGRHLRNAAHGGSA